jgi:Uma2 family endonuclease
MHDRSFWLWHNDDAVTHGGMCVMYEVHNFQKPISVPLPTMYDLPSEDLEEPGLPDEFHDFQPKLLRETCVLPTYPASERFVGADLNLYYDSRQPSWYKRPDWFLCLGVTPGLSQEALRWSYVIWQEGIAPFLVVELLSPGTADEDLGQTLREIGKPPTKWEVYERMLRVPFYVVYDRYENNLRVFGLQNGCYQPMVVTAGRFWFEALQMGLGVWAGDYQGTEGEWLRWYDGAGRWVPTEAEARRSAEHQAEQERDRADAAEHQVEQERDRADAAEHQVQEERDRADRLAAKLRSLGIDPDAVD